MKVKSNTAIAIAALAALISFGTLSVARADFSQSVTVASTDTIFEADGSGSAIGGGSTTPTTYSITDTTGSYITLTNVTGSVSPNGGGNYVGADGGTGFTGSYDVNSTNGISGTLDNSGNAFYLVGVFTDGPASGTAPAYADFSNTTAATYSPLLDQTFFVGDGLTGTGTGSVQEFLVPTGATGFTLGYTDAGGYNGSPSSYNDNLGSIDGTLNFVGGNSSGTSTPEPSSTLVMGLGAVMIGGLMLLVRKRGNGCINL